MSRAVVPSHLASGDLGTVALRIAPISGAGGFQAELERLREEERERSRTEGRAEGYALGWDEGERAGRKAGEARAAAAAEHSRAEEARRLAEEFDALAARMAAAWDEFVEAARKDLAGRAMEATRAVLAQELSLSREGAEAIVRRCLEEVPHGDELRVRIAAADLPELSRRRLEIEAAVGGRAIEFVEDETIVAGCVIESAAGRVDGRVETALELIEIESARAA